MKTVLGPLAAAALSLAALPAVTLPAAAQELVYGSWVPAADWLTAKTLPEYFARVEKDAPGEVTWTWIAGGQLAGGRETPTAIQDGVMDAGLVIPTYVPNLLPSLAIMYGIAIEGNDPVAAAGASMEVMLLNCPSCLAEARAINQIPLAGQAGAAYVLMCREPITSVAELKGKRIRASGASLDMLNLAGAATVSASLVEAVSLLQRGGLDCVAGVGEWLRTFGYGDFAKYVTDFSFGVSSPALSLAINRDRWLDMSATEKQAHLRHAGYVVAEMTIGNFIIRNQEAIDAQIAQNGVQIIKGDESFTALMAEYKAQEMATAIAKGNEFGVEGAEEMVKTYLATAEKWRGLSAEIGTDIEKFAEILWREVYSKVDPNAL
jgi:TRAP-type transport system periplasmic protein